MPAFFMAATHGEGSPTRHKLAIFAIFKTHLRSRRRIIHSRNRLTHTHEGTYNPADSCNYHTVTRFQWPRRENNNVAPGLPAIDRNSNRRRARRITGGMACGAFGGTRGNLLCCAQRHHGAASVRRHPCAWRGQPCDIFHLGICKDCVNACPVGGNCVAVPRPELAGATRRVHRGAKKLHILII